MIKKINSIINKLPLKSLFKNRYIISALTIILLLGVSIHISQNNANQLNNSSNKNDINITDDSNLKVSADEKNSNNIAQKKNTDFEDNVNLVNDNRGVPVLYYHSVLESADNEVIITPENLKKQLRYIKDHGYTTLTMTQLKNYLLNNSPIPEKSIVITFDDGYMDNYYNAFPILKDLDMKATIFCIASNLDGSYYLSKDAIKEMSNYGIDIESHTVNHAKLDSLTYDEQLKELQESKKSLEEITGKEVDSIAYPFGNFNDDSIKASKTAGYTLGFTTNRGLSDREDNPLKLDRIYISSNYDMNTFKEVLSETKK